MLDISNVTSNATASGVDCVMVACLNCGMGCLIPHPTLTNRVQIHTINRIMALLYQRKSDGELNVAAIELKICRLIAATVVQTSRRSSRCDLRPLEEALDTLNTDSTKWIMQQE